MSCKQTRPGERWAGECRGDRRTAGSCVASCGQGSRTPSQHWEKACFKRI